MTPRPTNRKPQHRILHLRRMRTLANEGARTLCCVVTHSGGLFDRVGFLDPGRYPEFEGEAAWVRVDWWSKANFRVVEQVADKSGAPLA